MKIQENCKYGLKGRTQSTFKDAQDALKSKWGNFKAREQKAPENEPEVKKPRAKMSDAFNKGSFEGGVEAEQAQEQNIETEQKPEEP